MSRVFVIQDHLMSDKKGNLVSKFDFTPAEKFGEVVFLLSPSASPFNPDEVLDELHEALEDFSSDDFLLLSGNPALIGWATAIAAHYNDGNVKLLQWSGVKRDYAVIESLDII